MDILLLFIAVTIGVLLMMAVLMPVIWVIDHIINEWRYKDEGTN